MHLHIVVAFLTQYVDYFTDNILRFLRGPLGNFNNSLVTRLTALQLFLRNQHVMNKNVAFRHEESIVFLYFQLTNGLVALMAQYLDHHGLLDMFFATSHIGYADTVAIHGKQRITLRYEDRRSTIVGLERVLTVGLTDKRTLLHLRLQIQTIRVVTDLRQEVIPRHLFHQVYSHHLRGMRIQLQGFEHLFERECLVRILLKQRLQHLLQHALVQSFSTFFLTHSMTCLIVSCAKIQNNS